MKYSKINSYLYIMKVYIFINLQFLIMLDDIKKVRVKMEINTSEAAIYKRLKTERSSQEKNNRKKPQSDRPETYFCDI